MWPYPELMFEQRMERVRQAMDHQGVDVLTLSVGPDLPWLIGYEAMPLERLTMLVVPRDGEAKLVIPGFEVPRVVERPGLFAVHGWGETDDPIAIVANMMAGAGSVAVGDHTWSRFTIALQQQVSGVQWCNAGVVTAELRALKEPEEVARLQRAADGVDVVATALRTGDIPLIGRTEADVSAEISRRILAEGHAAVNFAIVASGPNAASPHHHASDRVIQPGEVVLCDFGGVTSEAHGEVGYCSDITRCVYTGEPDPEFAEAYAHLLDAQQRAVQAATVGTPAENVDAVARNRLEEVGLGQWFLHRLGHGIGVEEHEDPYIVSGNTTPLRAGHAFSIEPGFYIADKWGARIEDIVVATDEGPLSLNTVDRDLAVVEV